MFTDVTAHSQQESQDYVKKSELDQIGHRWGSGRAGVILKAEREAQFRLNVTS